MERITLEYPIASAQRGEITELDIRRPTVGDHIRAGKVKGDQAAREVWLIQTLTELTPDELEQMDLGDYMQCAEVLEGFLASTRKPSAEP